MLAVLADLVRTTDITWREAKKLLKKDHRWQLLDGLEKDEKEKLFEQHVEILSKKKKEKFRYGQRCSGEIMTRDGRLMRLLFAWR